MTYDEVSKLYSTVVLGQCCVIHCQLVSKLNHSNVMMEGY
jgi:hypothetical protein